MKASINKEREKAEERLAQLELTGYEIQVHNNPLKGKVGRLATKTVDGEKFEELVEWCDWEPELYLDCQIVTPKQYLLLLSDPIWIIADYPTHLLFGLTHKTKTTRFVRFCRVIDVRDRKGISPDECQSFITKRNKKMGR